jgi:ATP-dependent Clp protease ATP-binding subunit ClpA
MDVIVFKELDRGALQKMVDIELNEIGKRAAEKGISLIFSESAKGFLVQNGYDTKFEARP